MQDQYVAHKDGEQEDQDIGAIKNVQNKEV